MISIEIPACNAAVPTWTATCNCQLPMPQNVPSSAQLSSSKKQSNLLIYFLFYFDYEQWKRGKKGEREGEGGAANGGRVTAHTELREQLQLQLQLRSRLGPHLLAGDVVSGLCFDLDS